MLTPNSRRFEEAAVYYHQALAIQPTSVVGSDMLNHLMEDMTLYQPLPEIEEG